MLNRRGDNYDFSELERRLELLEHYGMRPGPVVVHGPPEWASGKTSDDLTYETKKNWRARRRPFFPPRNWADYEEFVFALVSRFKDRIRIWEVMNEPNTPDAGLQGGYKVYMEYLRRFHRAAKKADGHCIVLCGRVGRERLSMMLSEDPAIIECFDGLVSHPYTNSGDRSYAEVRALQLVMAADGFMKPVHITEVNFFGGKWKDDRPPEVIQNEMARKVRHGLPLMAKVSNHVSWWTSVFPSYTHGLLRDKKICLQPLQQYWEVGKITGRLSKEGGPVKADVKICDQDVTVGQKATVRLMATNTAGEPQTIRFWPVGFVTSLGITLDDIRAQEWQGTLSPGDRHSAILHIRPAKQAASRSFPVGLAIIDEHGNSLALTDLCVRPLTNEATAE